MIVKPKNDIRAFFDSNVNFSHLFQLKNIIGEDVKFRHNTGFPPARLTDTTDGTDLTGEVAKHHVMMRKTVLTDKTPY